MYNALLVQPFHTDTVQESFLLDRTGVGARMP
jgi:hypothetical protein